jgi:hypothetical protein
MIKIQMKHSYLEVEEFHALHASSLKKIIYEQTHDEK